MSDAEENKGFKVKDRRRFNAEGNVRDDRDEPSSPPPATVPQQGPPPQAQKPGATPSGAARPSAPRSGIGFGEFILSLGTNAAVLLGGEDPDRVASKSDLGAAAQYIDIIQMLKEKTSGNLQPDETRLIDTLLYDLQMRYLEVMKGQ